MRLVGNYKDGKPLAAMLLAGYPKPTMSGFSWPRIIEASSRSVQADQRTTTRSARLSFIQRPSAS